MLFKFSFNKKILKIELKRDDLTKQKTEVIVNAANNELWLGAGVAGAIRKKGGPQIQKFCDEIIGKKGIIKNGKVKYTGTGNFPSKNLKYIFHAVGPVYRGGFLNEKNELKNCFVNCFKKANKLKVSSISIPPISSGIFGYPRKEVAEVFLESCEDYIDNFFNEEKILEKNNENSSHKTKVDFITEEKKSENNVTRKLNNEKKNFDDFIYQNVLNGGQEVTINKEADLKVNKLEEKEDLNIDKNLKNINDVDDYVNLLDDEDENENEENTLKDIYLVIIDKETFKIFYNGFINKIKDWEFKGHYNKNINVKFDIEFEKLQ